MGTHRVLSWVSRGARQQLFSEMHTCVTPEPAARTPAQQKHILLPGTRHQPGSNRPEGQGYLHSECKNLQRGTARQVAQQVQKEQRQTGYLPCHPQQVGMY